MGEAFGFGPGFTAWAQDPRSRLAITGASGWLGTALAYEAVQAGLTPADGRLRLFGSSERAITVAGSSLRLERLDGAPPLGDGEWLVAHFAFLGKERTEDVEPEAFRTLNDQVLSAVERIAAGAEASRFVFASSGAVYGPDRELVREFETSPYGYMKVVHEQRITNWCAAAATPLVIARIFNIGGPFMNKLNRYALSSILEGLRTEGRALIGAQRPVFRSYVHVRELLAVVAEAAISARAGQADVFDTAGREIVEIGDLAETAARALGIPPAVERRFDPGAPADWYVGDPASYLQRVAALGRRVVGLESIVRDTARWLESDGQERSANA